jgi:Na+-driven multidrug efflux pump
MYFHYITQIVIQVIVLYLKSPPGLYSFPGVSEILSGDKEVFMFLINFGFAVFFEVITYFMVPLVLLMSYDPNMNISVWSIIIQSIGFPYFTGYSAATYVRSLGSKFLAKQVYESFRDLLLTTTKYLFYTILAITLTIFIFSHQFASLFFKEERSLMLLDHCFKLVSLFYISECFMIFFNSALRMLGFAPFVFRAAFIVFVGCFPVSLIVLTWKFKTGAFTAIMLIGAANTTVCSTFLTRLVIGFKKNVIQKGIELEKENQEFLLKNIELKETNSPKKEDQDHEKA